MSRKSERVSLFVFVLLSCAALAAVAWFRFCYRAGTTVTVLYRLDDTGMTVYSSHMPDVVLYDYGVLEDIDSFRDGWDALRVDPASLEDVDSETLLENVFLYPYTPDIWGYSTYNFGIDQVRGRCDALDVLLKRDDAPDVIFQKFMSLTETGTDFECKNSMIAVLYDDDGNPQVSGFDIHFWDVDILEMLLAYPDIQSKLTDDQKDQINSRVLKFNTETSPYRESLLFSSFSD